MKTTLRIKIAVILLLFICCPLARADNTAPYFKLNGIKGNTVKLTDYKGKNAILFFWTTWCPFCRAELKELNRRYAEFGKDGVALLVINVGENQSKVESFIANTALVIPVFLDQSSAIAYSYDIYGVPTYVFIDKAGKIVLRENAFPAEKYKTFIAK